ncbi:MAG TPA: response regulator [Candidatus Limnocylindrales bacterium]|nr:response regulator [Candidatus Limnocylindrales bacterium]
MPASTILLIEADDASGTLISGVLTGVGYTVDTVADADEAFPKVAEHQLAIVDVVGGSKSAVDVCREIRSTPSLSAIPVLCVGQSDDVEERIRFLEAGADDVMAKPFDARELEARVEALLLRFQRSKDMTAVVSNDGLTMTRQRRTVAVHSPRGGVGTTTIATNVAMVAARQKPDRVVLVDLHLQFGQVATHLNLEVKQSLADVARDDAAMREPELLRTYASRHDSGLHVLAAPTSPELAELITASHVDRILTTLLESYDSVVIDAGSWLDERTMTAFEHAETVIFTVCPEIGALKALHSLLDYLNEAGSVAAKSTFVLNNQFGREILKLRDVESALGTKVAIELPYDPFVYLKAVNEGVPVVLGAARTPAADRLTKLSAIAFGTDSVALPAIEQKRSGRFGGLIRR